MARVKSDDQYIGVYRIFYAAGGEAKVAELLEGVEDPKRPFYGVPPSHELRGRMMSALDLSSARSAALRKELEKSRTERVVMAAREKVSDDARYRCQRDFAELRTHCGEMEKEREEALAESAALRKRLEDESAARVSAESAVAGMRADLRIAESWLEDRSEMVVSLGDALGLDDPWVDMPWTPEMLVAKAQDLRKRLAEIERERDRYRASLDVANAEAKRFFDPGPPPEGMADLRIKIFARLMIENITLRDRIDALAAELESVREQAALTEAGFVQAEIRNGAAALGDTQNLEAEIQQLRKKVDDLSTTHDEACRQRDAERERAERAELIVCKSHENRQRWGHAPGTCWTYDEEDLSPEDHLHTNACDICKRTIGKVVP